MEIISIYKYRKNIFAKNVVKVSDHSGYFVKTLKKVENSARYRTGRMEIDLSEFNEKSIMMVGKVFNNVTCNSHLSVLNVLMKEHKSK